MYVCKLLYMRQVRNGKKMLELMTWVMTWRMEHKHLNLCIYGVYINSLHRPSAPHASHRSPGQVSQTVVRPFGETSGLGHLDCPMFTCVSRFGSLGRDRRSSFVGNA